MGVYIWNKLPSEYQEVEYILNTSGEYIDTGFVPKSTTRVKCKVMVTGYSSGHDNGGIYGVWLNFSGNTRFNLWHWSSSGYGFGYGNNNGSSYCVNIPLNTVAEVDNYISNGTVYNIVNGTTITYSGASFTGTTGNIYLFRRNIGGGQRDVSTAYTRYYYMKIYDNGTLVRDFIPCYRIADGVIGLYDLVNNQFYTNAGTGTFTKGSDINNYYEKSLQNAYIGEYIPPYLCFTANTANSTVQLTQNGTPTSVALETSTDGSNWSSYTIGNTITLVNVGDKVYMRNKSETVTGFSTSTTAFYMFSMTGSIAASGDINYLLCKNSTDTLSNSCFMFLFNGCSSLTSAPKLPATTLAEQCYSIMFQYCTNLETLPKLPATTLPTYCYYSMFQGCSKIKLSTTQTGEYQTAYRIPDSGTGTTASGALDYMFGATGGTFTGTPTINTTYYTSNTVV